MLGFSRQALSYYMRRLGAAGLLPPQKSLAEGIICPPQGIKYGVGGSDAAFIRCLRVYLSLRCAKFVSLY